LLVLGPARVASAEGPPRVPLLVVPGFMGSLPPLAYAADFPFRRGIAIEALELSTDYKALRAALERDGYRPGIDLFIAPWDWRMSLAPDDDSRDGRITGLAPPLAEGDLAYGIGYLGRALAAVAAARPGAEEIDVLAHGLGGILVRTYLQSDVYGTQVARRDGAVVALPRVRRFVQVAVPNRGQAEAWNPWHDDFSHLSELRREITPKLLPIAFQAVRVGNTLHGPDGRITRKTIERDGKPDPTTFYRLYEAGNRALLPTYRFFHGPKGGLRTVKKGAASNALLLDLDASSPDAIAWLDRIQRAAVTHGSRLPTQVAVRRRHGPDPNDPDATPLRILPRLNGPPTAPRAGQIWFEPTFEPMGGDGVVPLASLVPHAPDAAIDPRIAYRVWRSGKSEGAGVPAATSTDGAVGYLELLSNSDVITWITEQLRSEAVAASSPAPAATPPTSAGTPGARPSSQPGLP
jgi:hypothetical protein